jgi:hypothetical protein
VVPPHHRHPRPRRRKGAKRESLPSHVHLRDKLEGVTEKFKSSPESVNLVLVYWSSIVDVDRSFVPALYGERFMKIPFHLLIA